MGTCPKCGAETRDEDLFCRSCGASLTAKPEQQPEKETRVRERETCFGETEHRRDYSELVSFGIFLLIVGVIFIANPNLISDFSSWVETMAREKALSPPPGGLITSATLFFAVVGLSNFFFASVRYVSGRPRRRVLSAILSGVALVLFAYLIYLYGVNALAWQVAIAMEVVVCGLLIIVYSALCYLFPKRFQ
ncbi:MAG TPA: zinc-ribbon domain-containing protein [Candidatus Bathyarchaeia archaeon]